MKIKRYLTLTTEAQAIKGNTFISWEKDICKKCENYSICMKNIRKGYPYTIIEVRNVKHFCSLIKSYMQVVKVEPKPILALIQSYKALEGAVVKFDKITNCEKIPINILEKYNKVPIYDGEKVLILKVLKEKINCSTKISFRPAFVIPFVFLLEFP